MNADHRLATRRAEALVELLDIPESYYRLAAERYASVSEWLHRPDSAVARYGPAVYAQGSFRYGTVIRPLFRSDEYDIDIVNEFLWLTKAHMSQKELKALLGDEIKAYAVAKKFNHAPEEKNRCWRLDYADTVKFHMDILPGIPEDEVFKRRLVEFKVPMELAALAIAITDRRHEKYAVVDQEWPRSNPRGFAGWFEGRMRVQAQARIADLLARRVYSKADDIPTWEWKTPLQRAIQVLKRHRDVMFRENCDIAPISMILTTLSAHAYEGEPGLFEALTNVLDRMPKFVRQKAPRIPNPVNPAEDFADRWASDKRLEPAFWNWHTQASADVAALAIPYTMKKLQEFSHQKLRLDMPGDIAEVLADVLPAEAKPARPSVVIASPPRPWANR
ncbi:MAG: nucleotidyltransferase [Phycisphaerae bacterium]|nr:MAG: nucleotidyltransferase [Phycisphaerae bacterium]MCQ3921635.1 nucleotidyltransferase [Planctomycetota bacterium]